VINQEFDNIIEGFGANTRYVTFFQKWCYIYASTRYVPTWIFAVCSTL